MTLEEEIVEAQSHFPDPPKNESNTCEWIILPLLYASGYARREIVSRAADGTGQYPDYTILPNDPSASFYVEAKAWQVSLEAVHAKQAINYANHNGKRFVVLTNGQVWQLYDNSIQGVLAKKLVDHVSLHDTAQFTDFMTILSKSEVLSGSLARQAERVIERSKKEAFEKQQREQREEEAQRLRKRQTELRAILDSALPIQLNNPDSELSLLILRCLNAQDAYRDLTPETLSIWFGENLSGPPNEGQKEPAIPVPSQTISSVSSINHGERTLSLTELGALAINGQKIKPVMLQTPDGKQITVRSWVDFAVKSILWLQHSRKLPIPFESRSRNRWFLNHEPAHKRYYPTQEFKAISANGLTFYMDKFNSAHSFLLEINALCQAMQIPPDGFRITIQG